MIYYSFFQDSLTDESLNKKINITEICDYYFLSILNTGDLKSKMHPECKLLYEAVQRYVQTGKVSKTTNKCINFLMKVIASKIPHDIINAEYSYKPLMGKDEDWGGLINILVNDNILVDTVYTKSPFRNEQDLLDYYRLKLGLEYYLLGIENKEGYLMHISFKTAVRTRLITGVYSNAQCKKIVDTYMSNKKDLRRADISLKDICSYEYCKNKQMQYLPV